jgi:hypothetical protein
MPNVFAHESFIDELAAAGVDAIEFRLRHLADERRAAILRAARRAEWQSRRSFQRTDSGARWSEDAVPPRDATSTARSQAMAVRGRVGFRSRSETRHSGHSRHQSGGKAGGTYGDGALMAQVVLTRAICFAGACAYAGVSAAAETVLDFHKNGSPSARSPSGPARPRAPSTISQRSGTSSR